MAAAGTSGIGSALLYWWPDEGCSSGASGAVAGAGPAGPVHPRRRLPDTYRRLRGPGRHAARSGHLRLSLGLADPGRPLRLSRRRNGTTVSVLCRAPSDRLSVIGQENRHKREKRLVSLEKPFASSQRVFCVLMDRDRAQTGPIVIGKVRLGLLQGDHVWRPGGRRAATVPGRAVAARRRRPLGLPGAGPLV